MDILIKGMAMPKNCFDCEIFGLCSLRDRLTHIEDRNPDCPLVEIPTPHGRLIDGDELKKRLYGYERWTGIDEAPYEYAEKEVYDAPTILEAEE